MFIRMIIWALFFYLIFRLISGFIRRIAQASEKINRNANGNNSFYEQHNSNGSESRKQYNIDRKDIVDADFTEIKDEEKKKEEH
ncbi:MAG: hypothetical protein Q8933_04135 [Bacteroidota bacterium]|nr:hypothetical protein [Bacteroidota bacterium]MDP4192605.1 hypothetical protein [Bacteroidota bacterium]MDP4196316.1 hypothetical protein [Bacteroidota bacterium]